MSDGFRFGSVAPVAVSVGVGVVTGASDQIAAIASE